MATILRGAGQRRIANLLEGSFDGGVTTGSLITAAFKTDMSHEDAIEQGKSV